MNRIIVVGAFGYINNQLDGQTLKTRNILQLLLKKFEGVVDKVDTQELRKNPFLVFKMFSLLAKCNMVIIVPCLNNLTYIFPIIYFLSKLFHFNIINICVGGWQYEYFQGNEIFKAHPLQLKLCMRIKAFLPELKKVNDDIVHAFGFKNTEVFPNFRKIEDFVVNTSKEGTLDIVYMARINKNKGYPSVFAVADYISQRKIDAKITFYGQIDPDDEEDFNKLLSQHPDVVSYKGFLNPNIIHSTLNKYDLLLLPTTYYTEGFPGSILDAYIAGIPVVVTEWKHSHEFVKDGITGFIVPFENGLKKINETIELLINNRTILNEMKTNSRKECFKYSEDAAWIVINKYL